MPRRGLGCPLPKPAAKSNLARQDPFDASRTMDSDFANLLEILGYLIAGTLGIGLLGAWLVKWLGPRS
jgi:hypothetical protein